MTTTKRSTHRKLTDAGLCWHALRKSLMLRMMAHQAVPVPETGAPKSKIIIAEVKDILKEMRITEKRQREGKPI